MHPQTTTTRFVVLCIVVLFSIVCAKNVHTSLNAKWKQTPLLAEGLEALRRSDASFFWKALDTVASTSMDPIAPKMSTQEEQYKTFFDTIVPAVWPGKISAHHEAMLQLELSSRTYSPLVEMHRSRAQVDVTLPKNDDGSCDQGFVQFVQDNVVMCDLEDVAKALEDSRNAECKNDASRVQPADETLVDRVHPDSAQALECHTVVLYGIVGTKKTSQFHAELAAFARTSNIRYVFRHGFSNAHSEDWETPVALQGYGVTLDVKNMEYKAVDEKNKDEEKEKSESADSDASSSSDAATGEDGVVAGFDIARLKERRPSLEAQLTDFAEDVVTHMSKKVEDTEMELKVWELQNLGIQAAKHVLSGDDKLATLIDTQNNFPLRANKISKISTDELHDLNFAIRELHNRFNEGSNSVYVNGRSLLAEKTDLFSLLEALRQEEDFTDALRNVLLLDGAKGKVNEAKPEAFSAIDDAMTKLKACPLDKSSSGSSSDAKRFWIEQDQVSWLNDLSKDEMYQGMPQSIRSILQRNYYGQPQFPRKNVFHFVYVLDPAKRDSLRTAFGMSRMVEQGVPVRIGVVLTDTEAKPKATPTAAAMDIDGNVKVMNEDGDDGAPSISAYAAAVYHHIAKEKSALDAVRFLFTLHGEGGANTISFDDIKSAASQVANLEEDEIHAIVETPEAVKRRVSTTNYFDNLGINTAPVGFFNGLLFKDNLDYAVNMGFNTEFPLVAEWVKNKELTDEVTDIYDFVMQNADAMKRYQPLVFDHNVVNAWSTAEEAKFLTERSWFYSTKYDYEVPSISHVVAVDASSIEGLEAARRAAEHMESCGASCKDTRTAFLFCSPDADGAKGMEMVSSMEATLAIAADLPEKKRAAFFAEYLGSFLKEAKTDADLIDREKLGEIFEKIIPNIAGGKYDGYFNSVDNNIVDKNIEKSKGWCRMIAKSAGGVVNAVHTNGRMTLLDSTFRSTDFELLEGQEKIKGVAARECFNDLNLEFNTLSSGFSTDDLTSEFFGNKLFQLISVMGADSIARGARVSKGDLPNLEAPNVFTVNGAGAQKHKIVAILDPVGRDTQKIANILGLLAKSVSVEMTVVLNPPATITKVPIKNFYHYVATPRPVFDAQGHVASPHALFRHMPTKVLLTMGLDEPEAWMVFASQAEYDLDNIKLSTLPKHSPTLYAEYSLESILLTGSCEDLSAGGAPPRGLPLVMTQRKHNTKRSEGATDTLVMSNYGYIQLQGMPGVWHLSILDSGKANKVYEFVDVTDANVRAGSSTDAVVNPAKHVIAISTFTGRHTTIRVQKRKGMEAESILMETTGGNTGKEKQEWPPTGGDRPEKPEKPTLNVFSVASGHLYERFLRMMMYTVMESSSDKHGKNTTRIKFWMIENFLSPQFKQFLPRLAEKYGFEYGLVTYRWPHWLRRQTEKQRTIWGYKILFLDVLFPLETEKIIFVDADQIVKADLHELYNMDLEGNAVAYTPFCQQNRNEETKGFRFWDSGFWVDHLRGRPYHISAIYVVDLELLRLMAAGDRYRAVYDQLSADPGSLANLDQDLPNFVQHQVPIFSLPEEWLWCETWCTQESKPRAKTIDLCNNPLTKTPKLENAKRIIPEWEETDAMLSKLEQEE